MSKYKEIQTEFRNLDSLKAALTKMGIEFEAAQAGQTVTLQTSWGERFGGYDQQVSIAVHRQSAVKAGMGSYDGFGFRWNATNTSLELIQDHLDLSYPEIIKNFGKLKQEYANAEIRRQARLRGYSVNEQRRTDGTIALTLVRR